MPIEIRELVIRAVVDPSPSAAPSRQPPTETDHEALVQACVDETLRILRRERER
jgi:hypothetical protein